MVQFITQRNRALGQAVNRSVA